MDGVGTGYQEAIMKDELENAPRPATGGTDSPAVPVIEDRAVWQAQLDDLLVREKAHTREGDVIAAARRRLPMVDPPGWPQPLKTSGEQFRTDGRPTAQWPRLAAGHSDNLH